MESEISKIFLAFKTYIDKDQELKENIKDIIKNMEQAAREIITLLQIIHKNSSSEDILSSCKVSRGIIESQIKPGFYNLCELFTPEKNEYYRYHDYWKFICQKMSFIVTLIGFLESGSLLSHQDVTHTLGIHLDKKNGFHLDLEDYLMGVLQLPSELSRLAVNCVVYADYQRPVHISQFVAELNAAFRLLNLKNDSLRKKFDSLKYDVKKIEEVVYDLSIRGLKSSKENYENLD